MTAIAAPVVNLANGNLSYTTSALNATINVGNGNNRIVDYGSNAVINTLVGNSSIIASGLNEVVTVGNTSGTGETIVTIGSGAVLAGFNDVDLAHLLANGQVHV